MELVSSKSDLIYTKLNTSTTLSKYNLVADHLKKCEQIRVYTKITFKNCLKMYWIAKLHKTLINEREEFMQETQHTQQTATRKAQNQGKKTA